MFSAMATVFLHLVRKFSETKFDHNLTKESKFAVQTAPENQGCGQQLIMGKALGLESARMLAYCAFKAHVGPAWGAALGVVSARKTFDGRQAARWGSFKVTFCFRQ